MSWAAGFNGNDDKTQCLKIATAFYQFYLNLSILSLDSRNCLKGHCRGYAINKSSQVSACKGDGHYAEQRSLNADSNGQKDPLFNCKKSIIAVSCFNEKQLEPKPGRVAKHLL